MRWPPGITTSDLGGRAVSSCGLSDDFREIFEITRLADFMRIFPDESGDLCGASSQTKAGNER